MGRKIQLNLTNEQQARLTEICAAHDLTAAEAVGQMIDGIYEKWKAEVALQSEPSP